MGFLFKWFSDSREIDISIKIQCYKIRCQTIPIDNITNPYTCHSVRYYNYKFVIYVHICVYKMPTILVLRQSQFVYNFLLSTQIHYIRPIQVYDLGR